MFPILIFLHLVLHGFSVSSGLSLFSSRSLLFHSDQAVVIAVKVLSEWNVQLSFLLSFSSKNRLGVCTNEQKSWKSQCFPAGSGSYTFFLELAVRIDNQKAWALLNGLLRVSTSFLAVSEPLRLAFEIEMDLLSFFDVHITANELLPEHCSLS